MKIIAHFSTKINYKIRKLLNSQKVLEREKINQINERAKGIQYHFQSA